jgi:hypothetical protein
MPLIALLLLLFAVPVLHGLDIGISAAVPQQRSSWNFKRATLADVLDQVEKASRKRLLRSPEVAALQKNTQVSLVGDEKTVAEVMSALDRSHALRFVVDGDGITAETVGEFGSRGRRQITVDLNDYGLMTPVIDMPGRYMGIYTASAGSIFGDSGRTSALQPEEVEGLISDLIADCPCSISFNSILEIQASPAEEDRIRALLIDLSRHRSLTMSWCVSFGLLPASEQFPTGFVSMEESASLRKRLQQAASFDVTGANGQLVNAGSYHERKFTADADIVNDRFDPQIQTVLNGKSAELRATMGYNSILLNYRVSWVDDQEKDRTNTVRRLKDAAVAPPENGKTESTSETHVDTGQQLPISLPQCWSWQPRGGVYLPRGRALVLIAAHGEERAVTVVELTSPSPQFTLITARADQQPLASFLQEVARQYGVGLAVDPAMHDTVERTVSLDLHEATLTDINTWLTPYGASLEVDDCWLHFAAADDADPRDLRFYDMRGLTCDRVNRPGLAPGIGAPGSIPHWLPPIADVQRAEASEYIDLIKMNVAAASWDEDGIGIEEWAGMLAIKQSPEIHRMIALKLAEFERAAARQLICRIYDIPPAGTVPGTVLGESDWQVLRATCPAPIAVFSLLNGQQTHHTSGMETSRIADGDIVHGCIDPILTISFSGLAVDVVPTITIGGVHATIRFFDSAANPSSFGTTITDSSGAPLLELEHERIEHVGAGESGFIPAGGATIYRLGERSFAFAFEVVELPRSQGNLAKPASKPINF